MVYRQPHDCLIYDNAKTNYVLLLFNLEINSSHFIFGLRIWGKGLKTFKIIQLYNEISNNLQKAHRNNITS